MTRFRPCIDLHAGQVKQIVGGTLSTIAADLKTNYTSKKGADYYANLYRGHGLEGAHVIMLGPGNEDAAKLALGAWPGGLQIGGGITDQNAQRWIEAGADKVRSSLRFVDSIRSITIPPGPLIEKLSDLLNIATSVNPGYAVGGHHLVPVS